jgi:hypothetical protein
MSIQKSLINTQNSDIEQNLLPLGLNLLTLSPDLPEIKAAIAYDLTSDSVCYSDGVSWNKLESGVAGSYIAQIDRKSVV